MIYTNIRLTTGEIMNDNSTAEAVLVVALCENLDGTISIPFTHSDRWRTIAWRLPGGGVEPYETPEEAATRELLEETNLLAKKLYHSGVIHKPSRDTSHLTHRQHIFVCEIDSHNKMYTQVSDGKEILTNKLFDLQDVQEHLWKGFPFSTYPILPSHAKVLKDVLTKLFPIVS